MRRLLTDGLIESSNFPWRAQPLIVTPENHKKRMVIDYRQTINKFTQADAYPLPRMQDVVNNVAKFKVYSTLDMSNACHQVELPECDECKLLSKPTDLYGNEQEFLLDCVTLFQDFSVSLAILSSLMNARVLLLT